ncbi:hypothetical protein LP417_35555 (plasmid) [Polaromonas sp. P1-6]|nr:hypothetical protein LP417_35555 [Polaromonas sp. P1-6]
MTRDDGLVRTGRIKDLIPQVQPLTWNGFRWFNDWAFSSAGRSGDAVWRHWAFQTSCSEFSGRPLLSLVPVWSHSAKIAKIDGSKLNDHELFGRLLKLCERTGNIPFHYFFYGLHGNIVKSASLERVLKMAEQGQIVLPEHDYQVLKAWGQIQYGF